MYQLKNERVSVKENEMRNHFLAPAAGGVVVSGWSSCHHSVTLLLSHSYKHILDGKYFKGKFLNCYRCQCGPTDCWLKVTVSSPDTYHIF